MAASLPVAMLRLPNRRRTITSVSLAAKLSGVNSVTSIAPAIPVKKPVTASLPFR